MDAYILWKIIKMNNGYYILWYVWFWASDIVLPMFWFFFTFILLFLSFCHVFTSLLLCNKIAPPFIFLALLTIWLCDYVPFMFSFWTRLVPWSCMYLKFDWRWYMEHAWVFHLVAFFLWDDQWKYKTINYLQSNNVWCIGWKIFLLDVCISLVLFAQVLIVALIECFMFNFLYFMFMISISCCKSCGLNIIEESK
jgi:hypothetical protein